MQDHLIPVASRSVGPEVILKVPMRTERITTFKKRLVPDGRDILTSDWFTYREDGKRRLVAACVIPDGSLSKSQLQALGQEVCYENYCVCFAAAGFCECQC